jgi:hypothetical protein
VDATTIVLEVVVGVVLNAYPVVLVPPIVTRSVAQVLAP